MFQTLDELYEDVQVLANGYLPTMTAANGDEVALVASPAQFDEEPVRGLRAMVPSDGASALDAIRSTTADEQVRGAALAHVCTAAQNLSDQHFAALKPIAPAVVGQVLGELRVLLRDDPDDPPPTPRVVQHPHPQPGASS